MLNKKVLTLAGLLLCGFIFAAGYNRPFRWWPVNDMSEQPIIKPFLVDGLRPPPEGAVALDSWDPVPQRTELAQHPEFTNPVGYSEDSVKQGEALYNIYCYPCHGKEMSPDESYHSPVQKRGMSSFPIAIVKARSDEYIYATMHHGGALMKRVSYHMSPEERWHVVNYIRSLKEKYQ